MTGSPAAEERTPASPSPPDLQTARAATVLLFSRLLTLLSGWAVEIALVRLVTPGDWDALSRFLTVTATATLVGQMGFPESILYFGPQAGSARRAKRLLQRSSASLVSLGLLFGVAMALLPTVRARILGSADPSLVPPLALMVAFELGITPISPFLVSEKQYRVAGFYTFAHRIPAALGMIVPVALGAEPIGVLWGMAAGSGASAALGWALVLYLFRGTPAEPSGVRFREQVRFAIPVGLSRLVSIANIQLDKYVVMTVLTGANFGVYYLGARELPFPPMLCSVVMTVLMSSLVVAHKAGDKKAFLDAWHASVRKIALVVLPIFVFVMVFADIIFAAIYGPEFAAAVVPFRLYQLLLLVRFTQYGLLMQALGRPRVPLIAAAITLVINAPLSVALAHAVGWIGPAIATLVAIYVSAIYTYRAMWKILGVPLRRMLPLRSYFTTLAVAAAAVAPALAVRALEMPAGWTFALAAPVYLATYLPLASWAGIFGPAERGYLRDLLRLGFLQGTARGREAT